MADPPALTPESFEILVVRELRKVGFQVSELRVHRRATLLEPERVQGDVARAGVAPLACPVRLPVPYDDQSEAHDNPAILARFNDGTAIGGKGGGLILGPGG